MSHLINNDDISSICNANRALNAVIVFLKNLNHPDNEPTDEDEIILSLFWECIAQEFGDDYLEDDSETIEFLRTIVFKSDAIIGRCMDDQHE
ncbi:MAG: hypothetical protein ACK5NC_11445 [Vibrio sp.]